MFSKRSVPPRNGTGTASVRRIAPSPLCIGSAPARTAIRTAILRATVSALSTGVFARITQVAVQADEGESDARAVFDVDGVRHDAEGLQRIAFEMHLRIERAGECDVGQARGAERAGQVAVAHRREVAAVDVHVEQGAAWRRR
jgi:hypothetical protein